MDTVRDFARAAAAATGAAIKSPVGLNPRGRPGRQGRVAPFAKRRGRERAQRCERGMRWVVQGARPQTTTTHHPRPSTHVRA